MLISVFVTIALDYLLLGITGPIGPIVLTLVLMYMLVRQRGRIE
jgi:hypothetical protein